MIWRDRWVLGIEDTLFPAADTTLNINDYNFVSDLIDTETKTWKADIILNLFHVEDASRILCIRIPQSTDDKLIWTLTNNRQFSVKSSYRKLRDSTQ